MSVGTAAITLAGETLLLHPERAVFWPARQILVVADTHFGKSAIFRDHGVAVPAGSDAYDRARLTRLVRETQARTLVILGDFLHGPLREDSPDARALVAWRDALPAADVHVVAGNHDRGVLQQWQPPVRWHTGGWLQPPFAFTHEAGTPRAAGAPATLSGHVHPVMKLGSRRGQRLRVPVFWSRPQGLVLPSFGIFTGGQVVTPAPGDRIYAAGPLQVVRVL